MRFSLIVWRRVVFGDDRAFLSLISTAILDSIESKRTCHLAVGVYSFHQSSRIGDKWRVSWNLTLHTRAHVYVYRPVWCNMQRSMQNGKTNSVWKMFHCSILVNLRHDARLRSLTWASRQPWSSYAMLCFWCPLPTGCLWCIVCAKPRNRARRNCSKPYRSPSICWLFHVFVPFRDDHPVTHLNWWKLVYCCSVRWRDGFRSRVLPEFLHFVFGLPFSFPQKSERCVWS